MSDVDAEMEDRIRAWLAIPISERRERITARLRGDGSSIKRYGMDGRPINEVARVPQLMRVMGSTKSNR